MTEPIVYPKHLSNFLQDNETVLDVTKWVGVQNWVQDYVETSGYEDWDGSPKFTSQRIVKEGEDLTSETLVLTNWRVFFLQHSLIFKSLKKWSWMAYTSVDGASVYPIRNRNGAIRHYHFVITGGEQYRTLRATKEEFQDLEKKFNSFAKWTFNWHN
jgi:hypothetical protein